MWCRGRESGKPRFEGRSKRWEATSQTTASPVTAHKRFQRVSLGVPVFKACILLLSYSPWCSFNCQVIIIKIWLHLCQIMSNVNRIHLTRAPPQHPPLLTSYGCCTKAMFKMADWAASLCRLPISTRPLAATAVVEVLQEQEAVEGGYFDSCEVNLVSWHADWYNFFSLHRRFGYQDSKTVSEP